MNWGYLVYSVTVNVCGACRFPLPCHLCPCHYFLKLAGYMHYRQIKCSLAPSLAAAVALHDVMHRYWHCTRGGEEADKVACVLSWGLWFIEKAVALSTAEKKLQKKTLRQTVSCSSLPVEHDVGISYKVLSGYYTISVIFKFPPSATVQHQLKEKGFTEDAAGKRWITERGPASPVFMDDSAFRVLSETKAIWLPILEAVAKKEVEALINNLPGKVLVIHKRQAFLYE